MGSFFKTGELHAALAMFCALFTIAGPSMARAEPAPSNAGATSVDVMLVGNIATRCSIGGGGLIALGHLTGHERVEAQFDFTCNVPFDLVIRSNLGGLVHADKPHGEGPYSGMLPYRLGVNVPALTPRPIQLSADFSSTDMLDGEIISSGDAIAAGGGNLLLRTLLPESTDLLAGKYSDSITIVVHPRL